MPKPNDEWFEQALAYAFERWCWDDASFIREIFDSEHGPEPSGTPQEWIDALAEEFDLTDPRDFRIP